MGRFRGVQSSMDGQGSNILDWVVNLAIIVYSCFRREGVLPFTGIRPKVSIFNHLAVSLHKNSLRTTMLSFGHAKTSYTRDLFKPNYPKACSLIWNIFSGLSFLTSKKKSSKLARFKSKLKWVLLLLLLAPCMLGTWTSKFSSFQS